MLDKWFPLSTANFRTYIMEFRGFDSSIILILRGGILMSRSDILESLSQAILVGIMLEGRLGVIQIMLLLILIQLIIISSSVKSNGNSNL